jgi:hypothetical protein
VSIFRRRNTTGSNPLNQDLRLISSLRVMDLARNLKVFAVFLAYERIPVYLKIFNNVRPLKNKKRCQLALLEQFSK